MMNLKDAVLVLLARNVNRSIPLYNLLVKTRILGRNVGITATTTDDIRKVLFSYDVSSRIKVRPTSDIITELLKVKEKDLYYNKVGMVQMLYGELKPAELAILTGDHNVKERIPREERLRIVEDLHRRNVITDRRYKELLKD
jgi:hypothetical protein